MINNEYVNKHEAAKILGHSPSFVYGLYRNGQLKDAKFQAGIPGRKILYSKQELLKLKDSGNLITHRISKPLFLKKNELIPPAVDGPRDFDIKFLDTFVIEKGRIPFRNFVLAISMLSERKEFKEIETVTGITRSALINFCEELKFARKKDPKRFNTVMDYLNAGRPYVRTKRNMLPEKPSKNGK